MYEFAGILNVVLFIILGICSVFMVIAVIFQSGGNQEGLGAITGAQESYFGKHKGKNVEQRLKRLIIVAAFLILLCSIMLLVSQTFWRA
ncbi:MAG: preprotein translocase subunit SecG [Firmicutes bacterium]|nr:preprotein translocase subunit SecG [Bacillota bacterium]